MAHPGLACTSAWSHERLWPDRGRSRAQSLAALVLLYTKLVHRGPWRQGQTEGARLSWHVRLPSCYTHGRLDPCVQERVESLRTVRPLKANAIPMEHCNSSCTLHLWPLPPRGVGLLPCQLHCTSRCWYPRKAPHCCWHCCCHPTALRKGPPCSCLHVAVARLPTERPGQPCDVRGQTPGSIPAGFECPRHRPSGLSCLSPPWAEERKPPRPRRAPSLRAPGRALG